MADRMRLVDRLRKAKPPRPWPMWTEPDGYYLEACQLSAADIPGLIDIVRSWYDRRWASEAATRDREGIDDDAEGDESLSITAWRCLAELKAEAAIAPMIEILKRVEEWDDWILDDLPYFFAKMGEPAIEPLIRIGGIGHSLEHREIAIRSLELAGQSHPDTRDRIVAWLTEQMANADDDVESNTAVLHALVELHGVEAAEPIERAFAADRLDIAMLGGWEDVRRMLGVEGLGLKMPDRPYDTRRKLRTRMGMGIFSEKAIFQYGGETDDEARSAYFKRAEKCFFPSAEAKQFEAQFGTPSWSILLLEFALDYRGEIVDAMTIKSVWEFLFDFMPRKVSTDAEEAERIVVELTLFWQYIDRVYKLPEAKPIASWLGSAGLVDQLKKYLSDTSRFGTAKSIYMSGQKAGYDMSSKAEVAQFVARYNASLGMAKPSASSAPGYRVGRNDPCPCGSGKKHKKCCGRPG